MRKPGTHEKTPIAGYAENCPHNDDPEHVKEHHVEFTDPEIDGTICRTLVVGYACRECMEPWPCKKASKHE